MGLSDLAKEPEAAGKEERFDGIREKTEEMLTEYARILRTLRNDKIIFPEPETTENAAGETTALSPKEFVVCRQTLAERLDSFDGEAVADYLKTLRGKTYRGTALTELFASVRAAAEEFDFLGAADALESIGGKQI